MSKSEETKKEQPKPVNLSERVTIYATDKHPFYNAGQEFKCGSLLVPHFVEKGVATKTKSKK